MTMARHKISIGEASHVSWEDVGETESTFTQSIVLLIQTMYCMNSCSYIYSQPAIKRYHVNMVQIVVTSDISIQICSIDTRDER